MLLEVDATGMYYRAAEEMGEIFISTELGGSGSTTAASVTISRKEINNLLLHASVMKDIPEAGETINPDMPDHRCFISSESAGLIALCLEVGEKVRAGQLVARGF